MGKEIEKLAKEKRAAEQQSDQCLERAKCEMRQEFEVNLDFKLKEARLGYET